MFINRDGWQVNLHVIKKINSTGIVVDEGWSLFVDLTDKPPIDPGDIGVFYSTHDGLGGEIRGLFVNGIWYIPYVTKEEAEAERKAWLADYQARKQREYEKNIGKWLATKESLRKPLQDRIQRFEDGRSDFWQDMGSYELFCCEQADKLLTWVESCSNDASDLQVSAIDFFDNLPYDEQIKFDWYSAGHSGNTYDAMIWLAKRVALNLEV